MYNLFFDVIWAGVLMASMVLFLEVGRHYGRRHVAASEGSRSGLIAVEGVVFALLGLLIAFTFSGAASRFDARRQMIVTEANAIGTAWLRIDLLPPAVQPGLRDLFRQYLDSRIAIFQNFFDPALAQTAQVRANALQGEIWTRTVAACQQAPNPVVAQVIPALNEMFDIAATRVRSARYHPPLAIYALLAALALMSSLLAGRAMAADTGRSWLHVLGFALIIALTVYVILDLEYPRYGFIRIDANDQVLLDLRQDMK
jgi:hypothetical protein